LHVRELLSALSKLDQNNEYFLYYVGRAASEPFPGLNLPKNFKPRRVRFPKRWLGEHPTLWWNWWFPAVVGRDRLDLFHGPNHFLPAVTRCKQVVTIHDVAYFRMPIYGPVLDEMNRTWTLRALRRADAVIALSQNTRKDVEALNYPSERAQVIYGGGKIVAENDIRYDRAEEMCASLNLPERFVLFVGSLQPRKNVPFLVRAFAKAKHEHGLPQKLVLAGHRDSAGDEVESLAKQLNIAGDVLITGYVESWHLPLLYKLADLFVLPTRYEGFTLVTLEAMAYGTPVIATDTSSIREGVGEAAICVPVDDDDALAASIVKVLTDDTLRKELIEKGRTRAALFSWENNARQTLALYNSVVNS
jgi:glycosyltransferase involved in cell wall biosynthesis